MKFLAVPALLEIEKPCLKLAENFWKKTGTTELKGSETALEELILVFIP